MIFALGAALAAACPALADINVEFRPDTQTVNVGDTVNVGLFVVSDSAEDQLMSAAQMVVTWNPTYLRLLGLDHTGAVDLMGSSFPSFKPLNEVVPPQDGDGLYIAMAMLGLPVTATPAGALLVTLQFEAREPTAGTPVDIPATIADPPGETIVYDGTVPNWPVTGTLTGAVVVIGETPSPCPGTGDCCEANSTPGCDNAVCCNLVCASDPRCCDVVWDGICADLALELCDPLCPECGNPGAGDCCEAHDTPFCEDESCCTLVCNTTGFAFCCITEWSSLCADLAKDLCGCPDCGDPDTGPCCEDNGTPYCTDADCCNLICTNYSSFCCDTEWDEICAGLAQEHCALICDPHGACCLPDGSCQDLTESACGDLPGGDWQGPDTECLGSDSRIIVWGVDDVDSDDSQLFVLNLATAELELIGPEHDDADIEGSTFFGNQVAGVTGGSDDPHYLVDMNFVTGALTTIASVDLCDDDDDMGGPAADDDSDDSAGATHDDSEVTGMATDGDGVQWAFAEDCGFGTIDLAGNFTVVVHSHKDIEGLAAALDGETLWGITDDGEIYEVDVSAGTVIEIDDVGSEFNDDSIENLELYSSTELAFFTEDGDDLEFTIYNIHTGDLDTTVLRDLELEDIETFVFASIDACPSLMTQGCGTALAGDCCSENSTAGCLDISCCDNVCSMDPYCCDFRWDAICVDEADEVCGELCACAEPEVVAYAEIAPTFGGGDDGMNNGFGSQGTSGAAPGVQAFGATSFQGPDDDPPSSLASGCGNGCRLQVSWTAFSATACDLTYEAVVQMYGQIIPVTNGQIIEIDCLGMHAGPDDVVVGFGHAGDGGPTALLIVTVRDEDGNEATDVLDLCEICEAASSTDGDDPPGGSVPRGESIGGGIAGPPGP
jgi:hypothetical protein